jgi:hypothetical protein
MAKDRAAVGQDGQDGKSEDADMTPSQTEFERLLAADRRVERRLFWGELIALACVAASVLWTLGFLHFRV